MKVGGSEPLARLKDLLTRARETGAAGSAEGARARQAGGASDGDSVQLSDAAQELKRLRDALAESADVRAQVVAQLREEIASGRYHVDGTRVADAMLDEDAVLAAAEGDGSRES